MDSFRLVEKNEGGGCDRHADNRGTCHQTRVYSDFSIQGLSSEKHLLVLVAQLRRRNLPFFPHERATQKFFSSMTSRGESGEMKCLAGTTAQMKCARPFSPEASPVSMRPREICRPSRLRRRERYEQTGRKDLRREERGQKKRAFFRV